MNKKTNQLIILIVVIVLIIAAIIVVQNINDKEADRKSSLVFPEFTTLDIYGDEVTNDIFVGYDVTMINIWATWCPPCIGEMDELARLHSELLPEGSNMISICTDGHVETGTAIEILDSSNANFTTLILSQSIVDFLNEEVTSIPTTIFVDGEGRVLGEYIIGAPTGDTAGFYQNSITERLE